MEHVHHFKTVIHTIKVYLLLACLTTHKIRFFWRQGTPKSIIFMESAIYSGPVVPSVPSTSLRVVFLPFVDYFLISPFQETAHLGFACQHHLNDLPGDLLLLCVRQRHVPFLKPQLPLPAKQQHKLHLKRGRDSSVFVHHMCLVKIVFNNSSHTAWKHSSCWPFKSSPYFS